MLYLQLIIFSGSQNETYNSRPSFPANWEGLHDYMRLTYIGLYYNYMYNITATSYINQQVCKFTIRHNNYSYVLCYKLYSYNYLWFTSFSLPPTKNKTYNYYNTTDKSATRNSIHIRKNMKTVKPACIYNIPSTNIVNNINYLVLQHKH